MRGPFSRPSASRPLWLWPPGSEQGPGLENNLNKQYEVRMFPICTFFVILFQNIQKKSGIESPVEKPGLFLDPETRITGWPSRPRILFKIFQKILVYNPGCGRFFSLTEPSGGLLAGEAPNPGFFNISRTCWKRILGLEGDSFSETCT